MAMEFGWCTNAVIAEVFDCCRPAKWNHSSLMVANWLHEQLLPLLVGVKQLVNYAILQINRNSTH